MNPSQELKTLLISERFGSQYKDRIKFELNLYDKFPQFKDYYLDIYNRGLKVKNTANSWVAWAIGITDDIPSGDIVVEDPTPPDIDTDYSNRDPILDYMQEKYGSEHTARIGTVGTMKTKFALKDIVRSKLGGLLPNDHDIHRITKTIKQPPAGLYPDEESWLKGYTDDDGHYHPGHLEDNEMLRTFLEKNPDVDRLLWELLNTPRSNGVHAGGVLITPDPIDEVIPTRYFQGKKITQIDYKTVEKIGGIKFDILGVNTLNFINAKTLIRDRYHIEIDPWNLPEEEDVFKMLWNGDTETVFQFDTPVAYPFLTRIKPNKIEDLIAITAVGRPGGLDSTLEDGKSVAEHFILRRLGNEEPNYTHPSLEPILGDTFGLVIYQEQIQRIFQEIGGFTPQEADSARRAVGKKDLKLILSLKSKLFEGARKFHGYTNEECEALWNSFIGAANYSFNKSHATAYAIIGYACAWIKYHYPLEWWASVLSNSSTEKIQKFYPAVRDIIEPPHVNVSNDEFTITDEGKLRCPLGLIVSVGEKVPPLIMEHAPYTSMTDFFDRIEKRQVNKRVFPNLILAGAFNNLPLEDDGDTNWSIEEALEFYFLSLRKDKDVPEKYQDLDRIDMFRLQVGALPIFSVDYSIEFEDIISKMPMLSRVKDKRVGFAWDNKFPLVRDFDNLEKIANRGYNIFVVAEVVEKRSFYYGENKEKRALKLVLSNMGKQIEAIFWPGPSLVRINEDRIKNGTLVAVLGKPRTSPYGLSLSGANCEIIL